MYQVLTTKLYMSNSTTPAYSTVVSMDGSNAAQVDYTVFFLSGSGIPTVRVQLQQSDDMENWADLGSPSTTTAAGFILGPSSTGITAKYLRVKYDFSLGTAPTAIVAAGINTTKV